MNSLDKFNLLVKDKLTPLLKKKGFNKYELNWNKKYNDYIFVFNIQKSKHSDFESIEFTLNVGIFSPIVFEIIWDKPAPKIAKEEYCLLRTRIGQILQDNFDGTTKDQWWEIKNNTDLDNLASELSNIIDKFAIPFLEKFTDLNKIYDFISSIKGWQSEIPQHRLNLAVAAYLTGNISVAENVILDIISKNKPWAERCLIAAKNMGMTSISP